MNSHIQEILKDEMREDFGELVSRERLARGWTARDFIKKLKRPLSPSYITKIEIHGEIPSPQLIVKIAEVFDLDPRALLKLGLTTRVKMFEDQLLRQYSSFMN